MSATIYSSPKKIKSPDYSGDFKTEENRYLKEVKSFLSQRGCKGKNFGEVIKFPVADGYAEYMVISMKPLKLMHLDIMDGYNFQYAHLMTAKEVQQNVDQQKSMAKFFADRKK